ncbi:glutathione synthetase, putative [Plasmodium knowlesi strain H]|uniref:glutathione synthase n=3 Tax=Plasmodium knowlesi TaxID=5850 RepID=A0A5K1U9F8_PLAKH|nr:glutathione synthetase, putative [Plasmodium knowlesi strain H]OTN68724.1 putative Glutathione synthetase [Plasmodium knowlesi]CAA9986192.1 glutathione synthetase, putative [Plasmodium knowlesi strain H]SBO25394.1 glutathione synthetase, putative [Plasmodium knowlesi strain H]SBO27686.1 glutathione synthetase, putative [Plasmodium knowlesi strain H]VVS75666.1 glutathione synthetase, putative [Plasmodium knowlesi strain H]|eukprot:XP_002257602.1 glutathione synthetase, putative [Plasmodium knowlesi strain H]
MEGDLENRVNHFYEVVRREILNFFTEKKDNNQYLSYARIQLLIQDLMDYLNHGAFYTFTKACPGEGNTMYFQDPKLFSFSVLPQKLNRNILQLCQKCTLLHAELFDNIVCDMPFLLGLFEGIKNYDEFCGRLIGICERVYLSKEEGRGRDIKNDIRCVIGRSDYMLDSRQNAQDERNGQDEHDGKNEENGQSRQVKQIEYNTISVAFGNLSTVLFEAHKNMLRHVYRECFSLEGKSQGQREGAGGQSDMDVSSILEEKFKNNFLDGIVTCLKKCHEAYLTETKPLQGHNKTIILSILHDDDLNRFDKYKTKYELNKMDITFKFLTLKELELLYEKKKIFLNYPNETLEETLKRVKECQDDLHKGEYAPGKLLLDLNTEEYHPYGEEFSDYKQHVFEISVIYFRSLYSPDHFNEIIWQVRELFEFSDAVKIPSLPYQLVGSKRIQMILLDESILKRYLSVDLNKMKKSDKQIDHDMKLLQKTFALQVDPSLSQNEHIVSHAIKEEHNYLLKPQREGGKNNLHGRDMQEKLMLYYKPEERDKLSFYVLMQKLFPTPFIAVHCRTKLCPIGEGTDDSSSHTKKGEVGGKLSCVQCGSKSYAVEFSPEQSISEISLFHNFLFCKNVNVLNEQKGYLVRTKNYRENEGGAISGISSLDSFFLV